MFAELQIAGTKHINYKPDLKITRISKFRAYIHSNNIIVCLLEFEGVQ